MKIAAATAITLATFATVGAQQKPAAPKTMRLYVFDCGGRRGNAEKDHTG
jgi:hypothetical protein